MPDAFRTCIDWLRARYDIVPLGDLVEPSAEPGRCQLALTFDDGYADWHEVAAPVLEDLACPATFFVSSGFVGLGPAEARTFRQQRLRRSRDLAPLGLDQLRDLAAHELFDIGSHTASHLDFSLDPSADSLASEVDGDRRRLEEWTGEAVRWFAYPWGGLPQLVPAGVEHVRARRFRRRVHRAPGHPGPRRRPVPPAPPEHRRAGPPRALERPPHRRVRPRLRRQATLLAAPPDP